MSLLNSIRNNNKKLETLPRESAVPRLSQRAATVGAEVEALEIERDNALIRAENAEHEARVNADELKSAQVEITRLRNKVESLQERFFTLTAKLDAGARVFLDCLKTEKQDPTRNYAPKPASVRAVAQALAPPEPDEQRPLPSYLSKGPAIPVSPSEKEPEQQNSDDDDHDHDDRK